MGRFLSKTDMRHLTGSGVKAQQLVWLVENGYKPDLDRLGWPILIWDAVILKQVRRLPADSESEPEFKLDFEALEAVA